MNSEPTAKEPPLATPPLDFMDIRFPTMGSPDLTLISALQRVYDVLAPNVGDNARRAAVQWFYNRNLPLT